MALVMLAIIVTHVLEILLFALGLYLAARAQGWWQLFIGYSLMFGLANGVGYGFSLQLVGRVMPEIKGFAMGAVTASYALGSILFAKIFAWRIETLAVDAALLALMYAVLGFGIVAVLIMLLTRAKTQGIAILACLYEQRFLRIDGDRTRCRYRVVERFGQRAGHPRCNDDRCG